MSFGFIYTSFEPFFHACPGRFIWFVVVVSSDMPDANPAIAAVQMCATMNDHARLRCMGWKNRKSGQVEQHKYARAVLADVHSDVLAYR